MRLQPARVIHSASRGAQTAALSVEWTERGTRHDDEGTGRAPSARRWLCCQWEWVTVVPADERGGSWRITQPRSVLPECFA
ncbi:hypothetical protein AAFF_G00019520 [Aldrovandia affinis]|uniref:Uncharacterized protein n=1 Tax=Aldrovandia affinis TaxID=143900 RepID=A0AAD7WH35_9TELE|nr:hypothetical protein AAFF_G00019520 [Aldrovandia affinis]